MNPAIAEGADWRVELCRAAAALMVVAAHYLHLLPGAPLWGQFAATGVNLFFVLSGYVFAPYLLGKTQPLAPFLLRRLFRLYPLYAVALLCYYALAPAGGKSDAYLLSHLAMLHTSGPFEQTLYFNLAFWSLPPEIEFYLALPLLALLVRRPAALTVLLGVALILHGLIAYRVSPDMLQLNFWRRLSVHLPGLLAEFAAGAVAYAVVRRGLERPLAWLCLSLGVAALALLARAWFSAASQGDAAIHADPWLRANVGTWAALCYAMILSGLFCLKARVAESWRRAALWAGSLSYGLYLFHNLSPKLLLLFKPDLAPALLVAASLLSSLALAWLGSRLVEIPARRFGRQLADRLGRAPRGVSLHA